MPDWQLWSLEPLFNHRKSSAWEMAKQTSFPSPSHSPDRGDRREAQWAILLHRLLKCLKALRASSHQPSWAAGWEITQGTHKTNPHTQTTGECESVFWESCSLLLFFKTSLFLKTKIIRKRWTFSHNDLASFFFCWHFYRQGNQDQCQHDHLDFSFFQILCFWQKRMPINMSVISLIRRLIKNTICKIFSYKIQKWNTGLFSSLQNGNNFKIF